MSTHEKSHLHVCLCTYSPTPCELKSLCILAYARGEGAGTMRDNPNLSPEQIDRIRSVAQLRSVQAGEVLYEPSQPDAAIEPSPTADATRFTLPARVSPTAKYTSCIDILAECAEQLASVQQAQMTPASVTVLPDHGSRTVAT
jgi:hypothetical protein